MFDGWVVVREGVVVVVVVVVDGVIVIDCCWIGVG